MLEEAHACCCAATTWALNEKHVVDAAGLAAVHGHLLLRASDAVTLRAMVEDVRVVLGA